MKAEIEANEKKHAEAVEQKQKEFLAQQEAYRKAHEAKERERIEREKREIAHHKALMAERRAHFEKRFKHVWTTGPVGVNLVWVTSPTQEKGEKLLTALFEKTLIGDVHQNNVNIHRNYLLYDGQDISTDVKHDERLHRIMAVTNDDRVAGVIEECATHSLGGDVPFDVIVTPMITGSPDYIEWIKLQTMEKEADVAFYNQEAEEEMHGLNNKVGLIRHIADKNYMKSEIVGHEDHVQLDAKISTEEDAEEENDDNGVDDDARELNEDKDE